MSNVDERDRRAVTFSNDAMEVVHEALHITDYTQEELNNSFYNYSDVSQFKNEMKRLSKMIDNKSSLIVFDDTGDDCNNIDTTANIIFCVRGLEAYTTQVSRQRVQYRRTAMNAVLTEQNMISATRDSNSQDSGQKENDEGNGTCIASVYSHLVRECADIAYQIGLSDEKAANTSNRIAKDEADTTFALDQEGTTSSGIKAKQPQRRPNTKRIRISWRTRTKPTSRLRNNNAFANKLVNMIRFGGRRHELQ